VIRIGQLNRFGQNQNFTSLKIFDLLRLCRNACKNCVFRQDLFQEEGVIALILQCIDKLSSYGDAANFAGVFGFETQEVWEPLLNSFYVLLAATVRGNKTNCARFAKNLDWLVGQLEGQQGTIGKPTLANVAIAKVVLSMAYKLMASI